ncbi:MAG: ABC transporter ATP-binding protein [Anaerolineaceae bacterium]|nr:ABC transporter ATP-binding protein [Anaerolineaceae bacterium]
MAKNETTIVAQGLTKRFDSFTAVDGIDFEVRRGEIYGFLGPNGSGKTTTIRMMLGLLKPSAGSVDVLGQNVAENTASIRPRVGYMSQRFSLYNDLTVIQNLRFNGKAYGLPNDLLAERIKSAIEMSSLEGREKMTTKDLSHGWRQRLALSAAILHRPELIFLDEPTAGVDPVSRRAFWDLLYQLISEGITVFVTTHYMDEAEHCHRLAFIQHGKIIAIGSPREIKKKMMKGRVLEINPGNAAQAVKALRAARNASELQFEEVAMYGSQVHMVIPKIKNGELKEYIKSVRRALKRADIDPGEVTEIDPSLEDVFIASMR